LITTSSGAKMGKTAAGAVWLDPDRTSPYDYYQFWINADDLDVTRFLSLFTFLPMEEIHAVRKLEGADLNSAKTVLAFEATRLAHGREEADRAYYAAARMFGARRVPGSILPSCAIPRMDMSTGDDGTPSTEMPLAAFKEGIPAFKLFQQVGLASSGGEARRLIDQGGAYLNGQRLETYDRAVTGNDVQGGELVLRAGKKKFHKIRVKA
jgi:tyrosyl-tRNA synthetase